MEVKDWIYAAVVVGGALVGYGKLSMRITQLEKEVANKVSQEALRASNAELINQLKEMFQHELKEALKELKHG